MLEEFAEYRNSPNHIGNEEEGEEGEEYSQDVNCSLFKDQGFAGRRRRRQNSQM